MATLDKPKFLEAMKKCLPGVELGASTIQGADTFLLTPGAIHTYNDTIAVTTPVDTGDLSGAVKANDLYKLLSKMNAPIVTATINGNKLHISGGRNKSTLGLVDDSKVRAYIATLGLENAEWQPLPEGFMASVKVCKLSGNKSVFRGVCVGVAPDGENSQVFTTDESRICVAPLKGSMPSIWIDDPVIADLMKLGDPTHYSLANSWFHAKFADGTVFSCKMLDVAQYPVTILNDRITEATATEPLLQGTLPKDILEVCERVSTMASGLDGAAAPSVRLTFHRDEIELFAQKDSGDSSETIAWEKPFDEDPNLVVWVDTQFLTEAGRKTIDFKLVKTPSNESATLIFSGTGYTQCIATDADVKN